MRTRLTEHDGFSNRSVGPKSYIDSKIYSVNLFSNTVAKQKSIVFYRKKKSYGITSSSENSFGFVENKNDEIKIVTNVIRSLEILRLSLMNSSSAVVIVNFSGQTRYYVIALFSGKSAAIYPLASPVRQRIYGRNI